MTEKYIFKGQTTFINRPKDTVIRDFQNQYIAGEESGKDSINSNIARLLDLVLKSKDLNDESKEEIAQTLHNVAELVVKKKANRLTIQGTLSAINDTINKAADIAKPAMGIITKIIALLG